MSDEKTKWLLGLIGLTPEDLPDLPEPETPTEEKIRQRVRDLLDENLASSAADDLSEWGEPTLPALREAFSDASFVKQLCENDELHGPALSAVKLLFGPDSNFNVNHIEQFLDLPDESAFDFIRAAFEYDAGSLAQRFDDLVTSERHELIAEALLGIRKSSKRLAAIQRDNALYQSCLRLCSPAYPTMQAPDYSIESDPAVFVCQSFGALAEVDLATKPYFDIDNPHFLEILSWLPSVVSRAAPELVREQFKRAMIAYQSSSLTRGLFERFIPLAALKLGEECRHDVEELLNRDGAKLPNAIRSALIHAMAIIDCGRDPLRDALCYETEEEFNALSTLEQSLLLAYIFDGQVKNGHVFQFLNNSSGLRASETCNALETLGDSVGLKLLQSGIDAVMSEVKADSPHEAARSLRSPRRRELENQLNELFTQYCEQDDVKLRIYSFALKNAAQLRK